MRVRPATLHFVPPNLGTATVVVGATVVVEEVVADAAATVVKFNVPSDVIPPKLSLVATLSNAVESMST